MCKCDSGVESTTNYIMHCSQYPLHRMNLLDKVSDLVGNEITQLPGGHLCDLLLFGIKAYSEKANKLIKKCTVEFVNKTKKFQ